MKRLIICLINLLAIFFLVICAAFAKPHTVAALRMQFKYTDLGTIGTGFDDLTASINNHDEILIATDNGKTPPNSLLISGSQRIDFSKAPGIDQSKCRFIAMGMNDNGLILGGGYSIVDSKLHEFLYQYQHGQIHEISAGQPEARENDNTTFDRINNQGHMIGNTTLFNRDARDHPHGFLYEHGILKDLWPLRQVTTMNDNGEILGLADSQLRESTAIFKDGNVTFLPPFPSSGDSYKVSGVSINDKGWVTGCAEIAIDKNTQETTDHAMLYHDGKTADLGTLGGQWSCGNCINNAGKIVGAADTKGVKESVNAHAFLYEQGQMLDLNTLTDVPPGWLLKDAMSINNHGMIVGEVKNLRTGALHAFLLTPITEKGVAGRLH